MAAEEKRARSCSYEIESKTQQLLTTYSSTVFACDLSGDTRYIKCDFPQCTEHAAQPKGNPSWILNTLKNVKTLEAHVGCEVDDYMRQQPLDSVVSMNSEHMRQSEDILETGTLPRVTKKVLAVFNIQDPQSQLGEWIAKFLRAAHLMEQWQKASDFVVITQHFVSRKELMECIAKLNFLREYSPKVEVVCVLSSHSSCQGQVFSCTPTSISLQHGFEEFCSLHDFTMACQDVLGNTLVALHVSSCFTLKLDCSHMEWPVDVSWLKTKLHCILTGSSKEVYETGSQVCDLNLLLTTMLPPIPVGSCGRQLREAVERACTEDFPDLAREMGLQVMDANYVDAQLTTECIEDKVTPPGLVMSAVHVVLLIGDSSPAEASSVTAHAIADALEANLNIRQASDVRCSCTTLSVSIDKTSSLRTKASMHEQLDGLPRGDIKFLFVALGSLLANPSTGLVDCIRLWSRSRGGNLVYGVHYQNINSLQAYYLKTRLNQEAALYETGEGREDEEEDVKLEHIPATAMVGNGDSRPHSALPVLLYMIHLAIGENGNRLAGQGISSAVYSKKPASCGKSSWTLEEVYMETSYVLSGLARKCALQLLSSPAKQGTADKGHTNKPGTNNVNMPGNKPSSERRNNTDSKPGNNAGNKPGPNNDMTHDSNVSNKSSTGNGNQPGHHRPNQCLASDNPSNGAVINAENKSSSFTGNKETKSNPTIYIPDDIDSSKSSNRKGLVSHWERYKDYSYSDDNYMPTFRSSGVLSRMTRTAQASAYATSEAIAESSNSSENYANLALSIIQREGIQEESVSSPCPLARLAEVIDDDDYDDMSVDASQPVIASVTSLAAVNGIEDCDGIVEEDMSSLPVPVAINDNQDRPNTMPSVYRSAGAITSMGKVFEPGPFTSPAAASKTPRKESRPKSSKPSKSRAKTNRKVRRKSGKADEVDGSDDEVDVCSDWDTNSKGTQADFPSVKIDFNKLRAKLNSLNKKQSPNTKTTPSKSGASPTATYSSGASNSPQKQSQSQVEASKKVKDKKTKATAPNINAIPKAASSSDSAHKQGQSQVQAFKKIKNKKAKYTTPKISAIPKAASSSESAHKQGQRQVKAFKKIKNKKAKYTAPKISAIPKAASSSDSAQKQNKIQVEVHKVENNCVVELYDLKFSHSDQNGEGNSKGSLDTALPADVFSKNDTWNKKKSAVFPRESRVGSMIFQGNDGVQCAFRAGGAAKDGAAVPVSPGTSGDSPGIGAIKTASHRRSSVPSEWDKSDDLPLMANVDQVLVKHYILDLTVDFDEKVMRGSIALFLEPTSEEVTTNAFQLCLDSTLVNIESVTEVLLPEDFEIPFYGKNTSPDKGSNPDCSKESGGDDVYIECVKEKHNIPEAVIDLTSRSEQACSSSQDSSAVSEPKPDRTLSLFQRLRNSLEARTVKSKSETTPTSNSIPMGNNRVSSSCQGVKQCDATVTSTQPSPSPQSSSLDSTENPRNIFSDLLSASNISPPIDRLLPTSMNNTSPMQPDAGVSGASSSTKRSSEDLKDTDVPCKKRKPSVPSSFLDFLEENAHGPLKFKGLTYSVYGWCVRVWKEGATGKAWPRCVWIKYHTSPEGQSLSWATDQDGRPCVFSPGAYINNRSLMPCQEPPVAMSTWQAAIHVPRGCMALMSGNPIAMETQPANQEDLETYLYEMDTPLPCSTLAMAVGWFEYMEGQNTMCHFPDGSTRPVECRMVAVPSIVDRASDELLFYVPRFLEAACELLGPYPFSRLDLLILPKCFACMGLKNPNLVFLSQSVLAGDGSIRVRVAHEISHAWFGLLIGAKDWTEEWLSEGFATYIEERIQAKAERWSNENDQSLRELRQLLRYRTLSAEMNETDENLQCLRPKYVRSSSAISAAEAIKNSSLSPSEEAKPFTVVKYGQICSKKWTQVHYLKGYFLLHHMEDMVGLEAFQRFLYDYVQHYKGQLITSEDFFEFFLKNFPYQSKAVKDEFIAEWLECPGMPKCLRKKKFSDKDNELIVTAIKQYDFWRKQDCTNKRNKAKNIKRRKQPETEPLEHSEQIVLMLEKLIERDGVMHTTMRQLNRCYTFSTRNAEIRHRWCELIVKNKFTPLLDEVKRFLIEDQGMGIYLFGELIISGQAKQRALAEEVFTVIGPEMDRCTYQTVSDMLRGNSSSDS